MEEKEYIVAVCGEFEEDLPIMATSKEEALKKAQLAFQEFISDEVFCGLTWWDINSYEAFDKEKNENSRN